MYDINAGNARPEMAEVGKGSNQLADYKPVERAIEADAAMQERKAIKKDEEAKARQKELMDKLAQMQGKAIMSHDTTGIAEQQQDLKDTVMKNIDAINKGGAGAVEAELAVNQKIATLNQNINSSVAKRQSVEALAKDMQANPNRYTKKSRKNVEDFIINGGMVKNPDGTWAVNPYDETQLAEPSTDLQTELKATRDALRETSPKTKKGYTLPDGTGTYVESETYNTSLEDVKDDKGNIIQPGVHSTLRQMYADNERVRNKAHELFEDESDDVKKQYTDPTTGEVDAAKYFAEKFASQVGHTETSRTSRTPQGKSEGAGGEKQPNVNMTFTKYGKGDWRGTLEYTKAPDNPYQAQTVLDPSTGEFIQANVKPQAIVSKGGKQWIEAITQPTADESGMKVPPKIVQIPYDAGGKEMLHDKFGIDNVFDIEASGGKKKPENIKLNYQDISKAGQERSPQTGAIKSSVSSQAIGTPTSTTTPGIGLPKKPAAQAKQPVQVQQAQQSNDILSSLDAEQERYYNKGLNNGNNPQDIKDFHAGYVGIAKDISKKYLNQPDSKELQNKEFDESINKFMDYEHENSGSVNNYHGGGSNWGTNNPKIITKEQAKEYYKTYWDRVKDLPPGVRTRAFQLAINTGDPYGELMVANGLMSVEERSKSKGSRKNLDPKDFNEEDKKKVSILLNNLKQSPSIVGMSDADKQALNWANANPSDKRAQVIKDKLKAKGIK